MKRVVIFLLGLILLPNVVLADMGSPILYQYDIQINNIGGSACYEYSDGSYVKKETIPYQTKGTVTYTTKINGKEYGSIKYNDKYCYVLLENTINLSEEIKYDDYKNNTMNEEFTVLKDNLSVYSSPASGYTVVGTLPKYATIKALYYLGYIDGKASGDETSWYYIEYNNIKGWIDIKYGNIGTKVSNPIKIFKDVNICRSYEEIYSCTDSNKLGTIPKDTIINEYYDLAYYHYDYDLYIDYNGTGGYVLPTYGHQSDTKLHTLNSIKAFDSYIDAYNYTNGISNTYAIEIPSNSILQTTYYYSHYNAEYGTINYNNKEYYVYNIYEDHNIEYYINRKATILLNTTLYKDIEDYQIKNEIGTLKKDMEVNIVYQRHGHFYIENSRYKGWIDETIYDNNTGDYQDTIEYIDDTINSEEVIDNEIIEKENKQEKIQEEVEEPDTIEVEENSNNIYLYIGIAVIISIIVLIIIILINVERKL